MFPNSVFKWEAKFAKLLTKHKEETRHLQVFIVVTDVMKMQLFPHHHDFLSWLYWAAKLEMRSQKRDKPARKIIYVNGSFGVID